MLTNLGGRAVRSGRAVVAFACVAALFASACSGDDGAGSGTSPSTTTATSATAPGPTTTTVARPAGPSADLGDEATGGQGVFIGSAYTSDLAADGYVEQEFLASGNASSYRAVSDLTSDGAWTFETAGQADYRTRVLVRRPASPERFSGVVVVEWLNVSGGLDADPEWVSVREEILRSGDAWVGVSAQRIGVEGGPVLVRVEEIAGAEVQGKGLKAIDPERYGALVHPGDGFSFDIFTQVARALRAGAGLGDLQPARVIAAGESQSAYALVTYYNGVQPLTLAFDGFYVHSRGASSLPLVDAGSYADLAGGIGAAATTFRADLDAPILDVQTEGDVTSLLNSYAARQPDSDTFRLWEIAGTAHADAHLVGPNSDAIDCGVPINDGPMHVVAKAALRALKGWIATGTPPESAPRLEISGTTPTIARDADGIARGGIRTPPVDVPAVVLTGNPGPEPSTICLLLGSTLALDPARLAALYPSRDAYLQAYEAAADAAIAAGYVLEEDRAALSDFARPAEIEG